MLHAREIELGVSLISQPTAPLPPNQGVAFHAKTLAYLDNIWSAAMSLMAIISLVQMDETKCCLHELPRVERT
jgi:hypothetical protein